MDDAELIALEKEAMRHELEWLLNSQIPVLLEQLILVLKDCLSKFDPLEAPFKKPTIIRPSTKPDEIEHDLHSPIGSVRPDSIYDQALGSTEFSGASSLQNQNQNPSASSNLNPSSSASASLVQGNPPSEGFNNPIQGNPEELPQQHPQSQTQPASQTAAPSISFRTPSTQVNQPSAPTLSNPPKILGWTFPLTTPNDALKGFVTLRGSSIVKADLTIKFVRWNNGKPFQTSLAPSGPWVLAQIQNSRNNIQKSVSELESFSKRFGKNFSKADVEQALTNVSSYLKKSMDSVMYTNPNQKFSEIKFVSKSLFFPALPGDLFIGFSVNYDKLNVSIHGLHETSAPTNVPRYHSRERSGTVSAPTIVGKTITLNGQTYEVLDHVEIECQVPSLTEALSVIGVAYEKSHRMLNKLGVFQL